MKNKAREANVSRQSAVEPEFRLPSGSLRRIPRKHRATAEETQPGNCKVRVTMYLDADVVDHFKAAASRPNAAPYQTQINAALRAVLKAGSESGEYERLLGDERFIAAVARRVAARPMHVSRRA
jgi:uncharacterized protein (DUF4415 family)